MNVLITGGAGYIGSHTTLALKEAGHRTIIVDNLSKGIRQHTFSDRFYEEDIENQPRIREILLNEKIDAIVHFAAFIEAGESMKDPSLFFKNNTGGTANLLNSLPGSRVKYFIFSSTAAVYGLPEKAPITEDFPLNPINPYGHSKLMSEEMLQWISKLHDIRYIALRYFNAAGADPEGRTGELHTPETHIIPLALQTAYGKREKMMIYGSDYPTPDGTCVRDYVHVTDLARAHLMALDHLMGGGESAVYNLGSQNGFSVKEIIERVKEVTGVDFPVQMGPRRAGDPATLIASSEKIKTQIGWSPEFTDPAEIIQTAHNFYKKHYNLP